MRELFVNWGLLNLTFMKTKPIFLLFILKLLKMFGLFKKKSEKENLQEQYAALMKAYYELSKTNRTVADQKFAEAQEISKRLEELS